MDQEPAKKSHWTLRMNPDPLLREKSEPLLGVDIYHEKLAGAMRHVVERHYAFGIAAPQLGELFRMICVRWGSELIILVNPVVVKSSSRDFNSVEQCLSLPPGVKYVVRRPKIVKVRAMTLDGKPVTLKGRDSSSAVLCHEIDHLDGVMIDKKAKEIY